MQIGEFHFPDELYYDEKHGWAKLEGEEVIVGLTDFTQKLAGNFLHVMLPKVGKKVKKGQPLASVESAKWVGRVYAPVSGEVVAVNESIKANPRLLNEDPYGAGWMVRLKMDDPSELKTLMQGETLVPFIEKEAAKHKK
ncbi:MAG: glycine cleavage system protein GcvH [Moorellaceae bacterium]